MKWFIIDEQTGLYYSLCAGWTTDVAIAWHTTSESFARYRAAMMYWSGKPFATVISEPV